MVLKIPEVLIHKVIWLIFVAAYINRWPKSIWCLIPENFHTQGIDLREVIKRGGGGLKGKHFLKGVSRRIGGGGVLCLKSSSLPWRLVSIFETYFV